MLFGAADERSQYSTAADGLLVVAVNEQVISDSSYVDHTTWAMLEGSASTASQGGARSGTTLSSATCPRAASM